jgi:hypothetical protein
LAYLAQEPLLQRDARATAHHQPAELIELKPIRDLSQATVENVKSAVSIAKFSHHCNDEVNAVWRSIEGLPDPNNTAIQLICISSSGLLQSASCLASSLPSQARGIHAPVLRCSIISSAEAGYGEDFAFAIVDQPLKLFAVDRRFSRKAQGCDFVMPLIK